MKEPTTSQLQNLPVSRKKPVKQARRPSPDESVRVLAISLRSDIKADIWVESVQEAVREAFDGFEGIGIVLLPGRQGGKKRKGYRPNSKSIGTEAVGRLSAIFEYQTAKGSPAIYVACDAGNRTVGEAFQQFSRGKDASEEKCKALAAATEDSKIKGGSLSSDVA